MSTKNVSTLFQNEVKRIAKELKIEPWMVTKVQFFKHAESMTEWSLRQLGGFATAMASHFDSGEDLSQATGANLVKAFKNKIIKKQATDDYLTQEFLAVFKEKFDPKQLKLHAPVKVNNKKAKKERAIVAHISDTHFGANIKSSEMGNVNAFNWTVASRRMALFAKQVVEYKEHHRDQTKLIIAINGDIIAGVIHDQEWFSDLLTTQFTGALSILSQFITYCASHFQEVEVYCSPGNHGRAMHKMSKQRAMTHKWDSYETMLFMALKEVIFARHSHIKVEVPKTPYIILDVLGHKGFMTHGDTVINVGNPGKNINTSSLNTQINTLNASSLSKEKFEFIMCGHCHVSNMQITDNGAVMLTNGTLSGADPYCQGLGIFGNQPSQTIFEVTKEHAVGDTRMIKLVGADKDSSLDKIIQTPELE